MFINPQRAINEGWVSGITNPEKQIQPNAIDFTLDKAFSINDEIQFSIDENSKVMKGSTFYEPASGGWLISSHGMIECLSDMYCDLPEGVAAMLVIRSTLSRNGIQLMSGLYDSGFQGHIGFLLHNRANTTAHFGCGTRVGQIIFVQADSAGTYEGVYNHNSGSNLDYQEPELKVSTQIHQEYELKEGTDLGNKTVYAVKKDG